MNMLQRDLFGETTYSMPPTESIKYVGSKLKMLSYIISVIKDLKVNSVLDGFSGSTRVGQALAQLGYQITSNDVSIWSETFGKCYLLNGESPKYYAPLIEHLNHVKGYDGWFTENYGGGTESMEKKPFQIKNTRKLDAIRDEIDRLGLNDIERAVALTSLCQALDSVDNTLGHYAAYLKDWSARSYNDLTLKVPKVFRNTQGNRVTRGDIFDVLADKYDVAYLDPPYGSNNEKMPPSRVRYSAYYHIWTTVILNDRPKIFGVANRREDTRDNISSSVFEDFRTNEAGEFIALLAIKEMIEKTKSDHILLSYSSGGRATKNELSEILKSNGHLKKVVEVNYKKNVMSIMRSTNLWINPKNEMGDHMEYLFLLSR